MELIGKIIQVLPQESGVGKSSGKEWVKASYILETREQYPRKVKYDVFGEQRIKDCEVQVGDEVKVFIDIESREHNGKYYTSVNAYKVEYDFGDTQPKQEAQPATSVAAPGTNMPAAPELEDESDNLPF